MLADAAMEIKEKVVIYTGVIGGYDGLPTVETPDGNCAYVCFTDGPLESDGVWQIRHLTPVLADPQREARRVKILPHLFLGEYDISLWVDANCTLQKPLTADFIRNAVKQHPIACQEHPERNCVYDEAEAVLQLGYDDPGLVRRQMYKYRSLGLPEKDGLVMTAFLARRHNDPRCKVFCDLWWKEIHENSRRDQLSFPFVRWLTRQEMALLPGTCFSNPFYTWGVGGLGKHRQKSRPPIRYALGPSTASDGAHVYQAEEYFGTDFLRAMRLFHEALRGASLSYAQSPTPLPEGVQPRILDQACRLFAGAGHVLIPEKISPLWLLLALHVNPKVRLACLFSYDHPVEKTVTRHLERQHPGQTLFAGDMSDALREHEAFFRTADGLLLTGMHGTEELLQWFLSLRKPEGLVMFLDSQTEVAKEAIAANIRVGKLRAPVSTGIRDHLFQIGCEGEANELLLL